MNKAKDLQDIINADKSLSKYLFIRSYIISDENFGDISAFPFYGMYMEERIGNYVFRVHKEQHLYTYNKGDATLFLIGNCVNPFDHISDEYELLHQLSKLYPSQSIMLDYANRFTGIFLLGVIRGCKLYVITDPTGMLFGCYGKVAGHLYISSHPQLLEDICGLKKSDYFQRLEKYRFFYKYGVFFPGDMTQYEGINRLLQNHITKYDGEKFSTERFYPTHDIYEVRNEEEYKNLIKRCTTILHDTMECVAKKYKKPAISLTGGMDSKTTLACTNGLYDRFSYYSYNSMDGDKPDVEAAHAISEYIGIKHKVYDIPDQESQNIRFLELKRVLIHNKGEYRINENDIRKRIYFSDTEDFDVEVKSWVSEIARANYYKKFLTKHMPLRLTPRNMTAMYKIFLTERRLAKETDAVFKEFIAKTGFDFLPKGYDASDMYLWEFRYSAWGGMVITHEHSFSYELFIPYNNRILLDLMLQAPKKKRITDEFHYDLINASNSKVNELGINVTNWNETRKRAIAEKAYFSISSLFQHL